MFCCLCTIDYILLIKSLNSIQIDKDTMHRLFNDLKHNDYMCQGIVAICFQVNYI